ncbi:MAG: helix-turn-helix domain-containing protein [Acetobacteraceae bacterium]
MDLARRPPRDELTEARSGEPESDLPDSVKAFAENLLAARKAAGLTQVQLSEGSGVSQSHISQLEKGNLEPRLSTILALAGALKVEVGALIQRDTGPVSDGWLSPEFEKRLEDAADLRWLTAVLLKALQERLGSTETAMRFRQSELIGDPEGDKLTLRVATAAEAGYIQEHLLSTVREIFEALLGKKLVAVESHDKFPPRRRFN